MIDDSYSEQSLILVHWHAESVVELSSATGGFLKAQGSGARLFNLLDESENTNIEKESSLTLPPLIMHQSNLKTLSLHIPHTQTY